jgi:hypothetical protein
MSDVNYASWAVLQEKAHGLQRTMINAPVQQKSALAVYVGVSAMDA